MTERCSGAVVGEERGDDAACVQSRVPTVYKESFSEIGSTVKAGTTTAVHIQPQFDLCCCFAAAQVARWYGTNTGGAAED